MPRKLPDLDPTIVRRVGTSDDLISVFRANAEAVGMRVSLTSPDTIARDIGDWVRGLRERAAPPLRVLIEPSLFCREAIEGQLAEDVELRDPQTGDEALYAADVGITGVCSAVAETGSLVCAGGPRLSLGTSLIPPIHVAIVRAGQIVPDLLDLFGDLSTGELPANLCLISGPSKTADIEGILITGMHGPRQVHVFVVEG